MTSIDPLEVGWDEKENSGSTRPGRAVARGDPAHEYLVAECEQHGVLVLRGSAKPATALIAKAPATLAEHHARLLPVTRADVLRVARRMIAPGRIAVALVGPLGRAAERRAKAIVEPLAG